MMMDWNRFNVLPGTQIRYWKHGRTEYAILLENRPYSQLEYFLRECDGFYERYGTHHPDTWNGGDPFADTLLCQLLDFDYTPHVFPQDCKYLIDDKWLTFDQVMSA